ncbi:MAG: Rnf-Nqr domain containing protein [Thermochromatium sp.]
MLRTLGGIALLSRLLVALAYQFTLPIIAENQRVLTEKAVFRVLPGAVGKRDFVIIATFVTIVDYAIQAISLKLYAALGAFIQLIVANCVILGRAEAYASKQRLATTLVKETLINSPPFGLSLSNGPGNDATPDDDTGQARFPQPSPRGGEGKRIASRVSRYNPLILKIRYFISMHPASMSLR